VLQLANPNVPGLLASNRQFHRWMTQGLPITYLDGNQQVGIRLKVIGFDDPAANDWLVVNQLAIQGTKHNRRPDVVVYLNGLPLAVIELKNPADEKADIWAAFNQLQTYKQDIPDLFTPNVLLVISDGIQARVGSLTADRERFLRWRTISGRTTSIRWVLTVIWRPWCEGCSTRGGSWISSVPSVSLSKTGRSSRRSLPTTSSTLSGQQSSEWWWQANRMATRRVALSGIRKALARASRWRVLRASCSAIHVLENPTLVMVTDRQDLDGQLFGVFAGAGDLLGESPKQADSRQELRDLLANRPSGGIIFTTIQKFATDEGEETFPSLTDRHNVVVICDEAPPHAIRVQGSLRHQDRGDRIRVSEGTAGCAAPGDVPGVHRHTDLPRRP
jgi:type I restriction enzyme R subunit